ncbi:protein shisa-4-like [Garra rufa]|uniref:protein shisa-4-like n=1 Tax=Garra rufa TaxID=137080 RepID=UPI003CCE7893
MRKSCTMASTLQVLLLLSAGLFMVKAGFGEDCESYNTINGDYRPGFKCLLQYCCGNCDNRYCCSTESLRLSEEVLTLCAIRNSNPVYIILVILGVVFNIVLFAICCCCPCCCIYKMCRRRRPVAGTQVTAVTNMQCVQQQSSMQAGQYPQYQPVPPQAGYGGQPMQMGPYQGQPYAPGPPPSYQVAPSPGYPTNQGAYDEGQAMYPMKPPTQPGVANVSSETPGQPVYNPAYVQPPNTGY